MPKLTVNDIPRDVKDKIVAAYLANTSHVNNGFDDLDEFEVVDFGSKFDTKCWVPANWESEQLGNLILRKRRWKPSVDEEYYFVSNSLEVDSQYFMEDETDESLIRAGNCFQTEKLAQDAMQRVKAALNDATS